MFSRQRLGGVCVVVGIGSLWTKHKCLNAKTIWNLTTWEHGCGFRRGIGALFLRFAQHGQCDKIKLWGALGEVATAQQSESHPAHPIFSFEALW